MIGHFGRPPCRLWARRATALLALLAGLAGCHLGIGKFPGTSSSRPTSAATSSVGDWTWVGGASATGASGTYGSLGTASSTSQPGARYGAAAWRDAAGDFYLFGGQGYDSVGKFGYLNDLWQYSPASGLWTWIGGSQTEGALGSYGTQGVAATGNVPGARFAAGTWTDRQGNFWLFGGTGLGSTGALPGNLNDLWVYRPVQGTWTWVGGSDAISGASSYGTKGQAAAADVPGARAEPTTWVDAKGLLWLFGGTGLDSTNIDTGYLGDLWSYDTATGLWTWIGGSSLANVAGVYGIAGTAASGNLPGGRQGASAWLDASGRVWLFGGMGDDADDAAGMLSDTWTYDPATTLWTWVGGSSFAGAAGIYGNLNEAAAANMPGGRHLGVHWTGSNGLFYLQGGLGNDSAGDSGDLDDLWSLDASTATWTWVGGSQFQGAAGSYGTLGVAAASNLPGARSGAASWLDASGNLWEFGGNGYASVGAADITAADLNDLWKLAP